MLDVANVCTAFKAENIRSQENVGVFLFRQGSLTGYDLIDTLMFLVFRLCFLSFLSQT